MYKVRRNKAGKRIYEEKNEGVGWVGTEEGEGQFGLRISVKGTGQ